MGFTRSLAEVSDTSGDIVFLGSEVRPVRRADNLTAHSEQIVYTTSKNL
jgi:hypothetical protein